MSAPVYTIGTESNAYFRGRDAVLSKDGKRVATLALQDDGPGVKVKVHRWGTPATKKLREELGGDECEQVADQVRESFWHHEAPDIATTHGYEQVWQSGRSGGWCVPHPNPSKWWENIGIDPSPEEDADYSEAVEARERFFAFAVEITEMVEHLRTSWFDELVREQHAEVMATRERERIQREARERREQATSQLNVVDLKNTVYVMVAKDKLPREELERILNTYGPLIPESEVK